MGVEFCQMLFLCLLSYLSGSSFLFCQYGEPHRSVSERLTGPPAFLDRPRCLPVPPGASPDSVSGFCRERFLPMSDINLSLPFLAMVLLLEKSVLME